MANRQSLVDRSAGPGQSSVAERAKRFGKCSCRERSESLGGFRYGKVLSPHVPRVGRYHVLCDRSVMVPVASFLEDHEIMTQQELNQQIARHTGESLKEVTRRGFTMLKVTHDSNDDPGSCDPDDDLQLLIFATQQQENE